MRPLRNILVATDFSETSAAALRHAAALSKRFAAELHVAHVRVLYEDEPGVEPAPSARERELASAEHDRKQLAQIAAQLDAQPVTTHTLRGISAGDSILELSEDLRSDLVVVGTHGRGPLGRWLLGSTAERVVRGSGCAVLVVGPGHTRTDYLRVVVPTDFSGPATAAAQRARELARTYGAEVVLTHVFEDIAYPAPLVAHPTSLLATFPELRKQLEEKLRQGAAALQVPASSQLLEGRAHQEITRTAAEKRADLIVMGTAGLRGLERLLLGGVAEKVLRTAPCPVWIERGDTAH